MPAVMSQTTLQRLIQYYQQCYQASFHSSEGHGLFDRDDITVLGCFPNNERESFELTEAHLSAWLVDADAQDLVLFEDIVLHNAPNQSFTTDVHYKPVHAKPIHALITERLKQFATANDADALAHFQSMLQGFDVAELKNQEPDLSDLLATKTDACPSVLEETLPTPEKLARWLVKQAKIC